MRLFHVAGQRRGIESADVDVHTVPWTKNVGDGNAESEGDGRNYLEVDEGPDANAAHLLQVPRPCDSVHDDTEDDNRDEHLDKLDERVPERLHLRG
ncbi:hypothetical protein D9M72_468370 [compost metagenome]